MRRLLRGLGARLRRAFASHAGAVPRPPVVAPSPKLTPAQLLEAALVAQLERTIGAVPSAPGFRDARVTTTLRFGHTAMVVDAVRVDELPARPDQRLVAARNLLRAALSAYLRRCGPGDSVEQRWQVADLDLKVTIGWTVRE